MESVNVMRVCFCVWVVEIGGSPFSVFGLCGKFAVLFLEIQRDNFNFYLHNMQDGGGRQLAPSIKFSITFMISCALFHFPIFPISHRQDMYIRTMILFAFLFALFWFLFLCRFYCIIFSAGDSSFYACVYSGMKRFWRNGEM